MRKLLLTFIALLAICGSTFAQYETHWPEFDYSTTSYSESDLFVAFVQIDGVFIELGYDNWDALEVAAIVNDEIRGCCFLSNAMEEFDDPHQEIELSIMRGFTENDSQHTYNAEEGLPVTFQLYDHANGVLYTEFSTNTEVLTGMTWFEIYDMDYDNAPVLNFISPVTSVTQTVDLGAGWSWFSSYIEYTEDVFGQLKDGVAATVASPDAGTQSIVAQIKSQFDNFITLTSGNWFGDLTAINNEQMYLLKTGGGTLELTGDLADPTEHSITLNPGWNWIGFPSQNDLTLVTALASITPNNGDLIKDQLSYSTYSSSSGWSTDLANMEAGKGYLYWNKGTQPLTLTYPNSTKEVVDKTPQPKYWKANYSDFATNLSMMVTLDESEFVMREGSHEIGAFVNGECRGSARVKLFDGRYVAFLSVSGNEGEEVSFQLYDVNASEMYANSAAERISYVADAIIGNVASPMVLHFRNTGLESFMNTLNLYPNPAKDNLTINGEALLTVKVYNAMGQLVLVEDCNNNSNVELNIGNLSAGVYTVAIESVYGTANKLVVKE